MSDDDTTANTPPWANAPGPPTGDETTSPRPPPDGAPTPLPPPPGSPSPTPPPPGSVWGPPPGAPPVAGSAPAASADLAPTPPPGAPWATGYGGGPHRLSSGLSTAVQVLFWISAGLSALAALGFLLAGIRIGAFLDAYRDYSSGLPNFIRMDNAIDEFNTALGLAGGAAAFALLVWLALGIVMIIWTYQAHKASDSLNPGHRTWSRGWSVGAWFIPFANYVIPKLVLNEIERIAQAPRNDRYVDASWRDGHVSAVGWLWWLAWIVAGVLSFVGSALSNTGEGYDPFTEYHLYDAVSDLERVRSAYFVLAVVFVMFTVSLAAGALYVRKISSGLVGPPWSNDPSNPYGANPYTQGPYPQAPYPQGPYAQGPYPGTPAPGTPPPGTPTPGGAWQPPPQPPPGTPPEPPPPQPR